MVVNDGEVAALAASMSLGDNAVLGISMGTSMAAGYVTPQGAITDWLNELAFAPVDYAEDAPVDEWSGDRGVGAQYFSQQAVARLLPAGRYRRAGRTCRFAKRLVHLQELMAAGDERARRVYETIGAYLGYGIAHYADFYELRHVLVMGRVTTGAGRRHHPEDGGACSRGEFPDAAERVQLHLPGEQDKRHGQAAAAASCQPLNRITDETT